MNELVLGIATQLIAMGIVVSVILLFVGIGILVLIHACIAGRAFRFGSGRGIGLDAVERGGFGSRSMSREELEKLPRFEFKAGGEKGSGPVDCAVCLESFKPGDKCRLLPLCNHSFHAQCVDLWLLKTPICPICRTATAGSGAGEQGSSRGGRLRELAVELGEAQTPASERSSGEPGENQMDSAGSRLGPSSVPL